MFEAIDLYCERTGPEFWSEPVNALTNAFFLVAAWFSWQRAKYLNAHSPGAWTLIILLCCIGIGSFLFHTFANVWSMWADVLPILIFQLVYLWLYCRRIIQLPIYQAVLIQIGFIVLIILAGQFPQLLNGSLEYAPGFLLIFLLGIYHWFTDKTEPYVLLSAALVFLLSLTFRSVDNLVCPCLPLGTHFLWHICNSILLYLVMRGYLANRGSASASGEPTIS